MEDLPTLEQGETVEQHFKACYHTRGCGTLTAVAIDKGIVTMVHRIEAFRQGSETIFNTFRNIL